MNKDEDHLFKERMGGLYFMAEGEQKNALENQFMELPIIRIGNSKGILLSKTILEQYNIQDKVELILEDNRIVLKPVRRPREGWEAAFRQMLAKGDDRLLIPDVFEEDIELD